MLAQRVGVFVAAANFVFSAAFWIKPALAETPAATTFCANIPYPPSSNTLLPQFTINLDLPVEQRWTRVGRQYASEIRAVIDFFKSIVPFPLRALLTESFNLLSAPMLARTLPSEYVGEMRGLAAAAGVPFGQILLANLFYELRSLSGMACTSIVARTVDGKSVIHARNLDFGDFGGQVVHSSNHTKQWKLTELLRPMAFNAKFVRNGRVAWVSTHFVGYIGVSTGVRPNAFSISLNTRRHDGFIQSEQDTLHWLLGGGVIGRPDRVGHWTSFVARRTLERAATFATARAMLSKTSLIAPVYFTIAGTRPDEGCVISRAPAGSTLGDDVRCLSGGGRGATGVKHPWFVLQTNFDWWKPQGDARKARAVQCMNATIKFNGTTPAGLFNVLSTKPILNTKTIYTSFLSAKQGRLDSYAKRCVGEGC